MEEEFSKRCPLGLKSVSEVTTCELGAERVEWMKNHPRCSESQEAKAPGCPWSIDSFPEFGNCWWKFMAKSGAIGVGCTEEYIAQSLHLSVRQVREILANSKKQLLQHETVAEMKDLHSTGDLFLETHEDDDDLDFYTPTGFSFVEHSTKTVGSGEDDGTVVAPSENNGKTVRRGPKITPLVPSPDL